MYGNTREMIGNERRQISTSYCRVTLDRPMHGNTGNHREMTASGKFNHLMHSLTGEAERMETLTKYKKITAGRQLNHLSQSESTEAECMERKYTGNGSKRRMEM